jgi:HD-GYP domain-containing protein (c-di-GMP phosphodiesterase class II)
VSAVALKPVEARVRALARRRGWPHAVLSADLEVLAGAPSAGWWRRTLPRLKPARRGTALALRWPKGARGAALPLANDGYLVLGPFRGAAGPDAETLRALADGLRSHLEVSDQLVLTTHALEAKTHTLEAVVHLGKVLSAVKDLGTLVGMIAEQVHVLEADRGSVFLIDPEREELYSLVALGAEIKEIRFPISKGLAGWVARTGEVLNVPDAYRDDRFNPEFDRKTGYRTRSVLAVPMVDPRGTRIGVMQVINKKGGGAFSREDVELLEAMASEAAIAIANVRLVEEQKQLFDSAIATMAAALDARDPMTAGHTHRVTEYAVGIGRHLGLDRGLLERIRIAGMLHDLGKIGTPDAVLKKPGKLTDEEFEIIKQHAAYTRTIVRNLKLPPELKGLAEESAGHHERLDGSGYPDGLRGEAIPLVARILAVADVFDAITSKRHYRDAMRIDQALDVIRRGEGSHFDPACVAAFFRYFEAELRSRFEAGPRDGGEGGGA